MDRSPIKCCYQGCERRGLYAAVKVGDPIPNGPLYCNAHVILVAHARHQEGGKEPTIQGGHERLDVLPSIVRGFVETGAKDDA
jgi:hypothetical protein